MNTITMRRALAASIASTGLLHGIANAFLVQPEPAAPPAARAAMGLWNPGVTAQPPDGMSSRDECSSSPTRGAEHQRITNAEAASASSRHARGTIVALLASNTTEGSMPRRPMLRLRTIVGPDETLLVLEGRLAGPWVDELARCWARLREGNHAAPIRVDLDGVTFISTAGKMLLARLHDAGARLTARAIMTSAIIDEIAEAKGTR